MSVSISGFDKECPRCDNSSMFGIKIFERKWIIFKEYKYTEYKCVCCGYFQGIPIEVKRNDILEKLGI